VTYAQEVAAIRETLRKVAETCPPELREQARRAAQVEVARIRKQPAPPADIAAVLAEQPAPPSAPGLADRLDDYARSTVGGTNTAELTALLHEAAAALRAAEQDTARLEAENERLRKELEEAYKQWPKSG
jgi:hypothetical protein